MQFSLHRVWLLCRKQWAENQQLYLLGTLAMAGIMTAVIIYNLTTYRGLDNETQSLIFFMGAVPAGSIFTSTILSQFSDKVKGIQALTLPASTFEKLLTALIYSLVIFPLVYLLIVCPLLAIGRYIDTQLLGRVNARFGPGSIDNTYVFITVFIIFQTFALVGSVLFKRFVYIKSVILVIALFFSIQLINPLIQKGIFKTNEKKAVKASIQEIYFGRNFEVVSKANSKAIIYPHDFFGSPYGDVTFVSEAGAHKNFMGHGYSNNNVGVHNPYDGAFAILFYLIAPFLWIVTWFRLKEKQL